MIVLGPHVDILISAIHVPFNQSSYSYPLDELVQNIKENGLMCPVFVFSGDNKTYTMIGGRRRLEAYKILGHTTIPAVVSNDPESLTFLKG
jgi:ParB/RepB/Spo0J family partition protein